MQFKPVLWYTMYIYHTILLLYTLYMYMYCRYYTCTVCTCTCIYIHCEVVMEGVEEVGLGVGRLVEEGEEL